MAAYPSLPVGADSNVRMVDDVQIRRATNGAARGRVTFLAPKWVFDVRHPMMSADQRATIDAFYLANRTTAFDFYWLPDDAFYSCVFSGPPQYKIVVRWYFASVMLEQV